MDGCLGLAGSSPGDLHMVLCPLFLSKALHTNNSHPSPANY